MIVGIDIGYGYTKAVAPDRRVVFPSVVGKAERVRYESDLRQPGTDAGAISHATSCEIARDPARGIAIKTEQGDHFVGDLALLQSRVQWTLLDRSRVEDPSARLLFLAALSQLDPSLGLPGRPASAGEGAHSFRVVTGLPVNWYADRDKVVEQLSGRHVVRRVNGQEALHRFTVDEVLVVPQPFGSLFDAILGSEGQIVDEGLAEGRLAVIDIGTYTTDYVLVDRLRYIERGSGTIPSAMSKAYELVGRAILDTYGLELRMHEVDRAVREGVVTVFGEERSVDWLADPALDALAQQVLAQAGTLWGDGRDLQAVLVTGGGAVALGERICRRYAHARVLPDAALANVNGFYKYGRRKWRQEAQ